ncbi:MAG: hypothetical protein V4485_06385 [Pseudomonadota bacterium]
MLKSYKTDYKTISREDTHDKWLERNELAERSITPPLVFERSLSNEHYTSSTLIRCSSERIDQRLEELGGLILSLKHINASGVNNLDSVIEQLTAECLNLKVKKDSTLSKYQNAVETYEKYLETHPGLVFVDETYTLDPSPSLGFVVRYSVDLTSMKVESSGALLGVKSNQITEDITTTSKKSGSSKAASDKTSKGKLLHPIEIELLTKAIKALLENTQKAVVVDILIKKKTDLSNINPACRKFIL